MTTDEMIANWHRKKRGWSKELTEFQIGVLIALFIIAGGLTGLLIRVLL